MARTPRKLPYGVYDARTKRERIIEAPSAAVALQHVVGTRYTVRALTGSQVLALTRAGVQVETAGTPPLPMAPPAPPPAPAEPSAQAEPSDGPLRVAPEKDIEVQLVNPDAVDFTPPGAQS